MSKRNKALGMTWQHWNVTEDWIKAECECHLNDPIIEALSPVNDMSPEKTAALRSTLFIQEATIVELRSQTVDLGNQISELNQKMQQIKSQHMEITSSITWRIARKISRFVDIILPPNTRRRLFAKRMLLSLRRS